MLRPLLRTVAVGLAVLVAACGGGDGGAGLPVSPYPELPAPVVASAWGRQLQLESAQDPRLERFVTRFREGPQAPEPGAACRGQGTPLALGS